MKANVQRSQEKGLCCALSDLLDILASFPSFPLFKTSIFLFIPAFAGSSELFEVSYRFIIVNILRLQESKKALFYTNKKVLEKREQLSDIFS